MSWRSVYRLVLHLLPARLRGKHGEAMEAAFTRELEQARARTRLHAALIGATGVWDVVRRAAYEQARPDRTARERTSQPTTGQLLRRHAASFAVAAVTLTLALLAIFARRQLPTQIPRGASASTIAEALLLALPFIAAMTIPMAVFVAVLWEFSRLNLDGTLAAARHAHDGVRRLVVPVLAAAAGVTLLAFVLVAEIVPRTNARLTTLLAIRATAPNARTMTLGELRVAERALRPASEAGGLVDELVVYEIETQKKFALPAACMVLAGLAMVTALGAPRGGAALGASGAVFGAYYVLFTTGERLAARLVVSPFVGLWAPDALVLAFALLVAWRHRTRLAPGGSGPVALRG